mmetsp:Transcript_56989/g.124660  ORF Transcript_56989/g.124660 Transcript_56989/m.124660 type:complete len:568 (+) Transcript_56989:413-2116(+)
MQADLAQRLAGDIIEEHFGSAARLVVNCLLARGPLPLVDILRFLFEGRDPVTEAPLRFAHVRNALLTLVQHNIVRSRPLPSAVETGDAVQALKREYAVDLDDVLIRLRFPKFIEHVCAHHGDVPAELLAVVLKHGRCTADFATQEILPYLQDVTVPEIKECFEVLIKECYVVVSDPTTKPTSTPASSSTAVPAQGNGNSTNGAASPPAEGQLVAADRSSPEAGEGEEAAGSRVYRFNRPVLDLCVFKCLVVRFVEDRIGASSAQVMATMLSMVRPKKGGGVEAEFMNFGRVEEKMRALGHVPAGRETSRVRENLSRELEAMSVGEESLLQRRITSSSKMGDSGSTSLPLHAPPQAQSDTPGGQPNKRRRGPAGGAVPAEPQRGFQPPAANVPTYEWAVRWTSVRKFLADAATSQLIRDQFGAAGLRMFNLLKANDPPQKLEDTHIFEICFVPPTEGRQILNEMVRRCVVHWQEVPRTSGSPLSASFWLYYVDVRRLQAALVWNVLQAVMNLRCRFRAEVSKGETLESRQHSLTRKELHTLKANRRREDILERSFLVLDTALHIFRQS